MFHLQVLSLLVSHFLHMPTCRSGKWPGWHLNMTQSLMGRRGMGRSSRWRKSLEWRPLSETRTHSTTWIGLYYTHTHSRYPWSGMKTCDLCWMCWRTKTMSLSLKRLTTVEVWMLHMKSHLSNKIGFNKALLHQFISLAITCAVNPPIVRSCSLLYNCPWLNKRRGCFVSRKDAWNIHCTQPSRKHCWPLRSETQEYAVCALTWDFPNLRFIQQCFVLLLTAFPETGFVLLQLPCLCRFVHRLKTEGES